MERETAIKLLKAQLQLKMIGRAVTMVASRQPRNYTLHLLYNAFVIPTDINKNWFTGLAVMLTHQRHLGIYLIQKAIQLSGKKPLPLKDIQQLAIVIQTSAKLTKADAG